MEELKVPSEYMLGKDDHRHQLSLFMHWWIGIMVDELEKCDNEEVIIVNGIFMCLLKQMILCL